MSTKSKIATKYFIPPDIDENSVVISGGGFIGEWDYYMMKTYGCYLYIFEPFPENFKQLRRLFGSNPKIKLYEAALFDKDGYANLHLIEKNNGHSLYDRSHDRTIVDVLQVQSVRLKTFVEEQEIGQVDLLKLNVEGAEVQILRDIDKSLASKIKCICFSSHERKIVAEAKHLATLSHLCKVGYKVRPHNPVEWVGPSGYFNRWKCTYENSLSL